jgi:hypothetical protein
MSSTREEDDFNNISTAATTAGSFDDSQQQQQQQRRQQQYVSGPSIVTTSTRRARAATSSTSYVEQQERSSELESLLRGQANRDQLMQQLGVLGKPRSQSLPTVARFTNDEINTWLETTSVAASATHDAIVKSASDHISSGGQQQQQLQRRNPYDGEYDDDDDDDDEVVKVESGDDKFEWDSSGAVGLGSGVVTSTLLGHSDPLAVMAKSRSASSDQIRAPSSDGDGVGGTSSGGPSNHPLGRSLDDIRLANAFDRHALMQFEHDRKVAKFDAEESIRLQQRQQQQQQQQQQTSTKQSTTTTTMTTFSDVDMDHLARRLSSSASAQLSASSMFGRPTTTTTTLTATTTTASTNLAEITPGGPTPTSTPPMTIWDKVRQISDILPHVTALRALAALRASNESVDDAVNRLLTNVR